MRQVSRCPLHHDSERGETLECKQCTAPCKGCGSDKACCEFARDKGFLKAHCKECMRAKLEKHEADAESLCLHEGRVLGELQYLTVAEKFVTSMRLPGLSQHVVKRRWDMTTKMTGVSISNYIGLSEEECRAWPLLYREMVLQGTGRKRTVYPAALNVHYDFVNTAALPGPDATEDEVRAMFRVHMNPHKMTVSKL